MDGILGGFYKQASYHVNDQGEVKVKRAAYL